LGYLKEFIKRFYQVFPVAKGLTAYGQQLKSSHLLFMS